MTQVKFHENALPDWVKAERFPAEDGRPAFAVLTIGWDATTVLSREVQLFTTESNLIKLANAITRAVANIREAG
jgi:hypothetical protein